MFCSYLRGMFVSVRVCLLWWRSCRWTALTSRQQRRTGKNMKKKTAGEQRRKHCRSGKTFHVCQRKFGFWRNSTFYTHTGGNLCFSRYRRMAKIRDAPLKDVIHASFNCLKGGHLSFLAFSKISD